MKAGVTGFHGEQPSRAREQLGMETGGRAFTGAEPTSPTALWAWGRDIFDA